MWVEGGEIPTRYKGCLEGDTAVAADNLSCSSGQRLVRYQEKFFGVAGGTIYEAMGPMEKDKQYLKMIGTLPGLRLRFVRLDARPVIVPLRRLSRPPGHRDTP